MTLKKVLDLTNLPKRPEYSEELKEGAILTFIRQVYPEVPNPKECGIYETLIDCYYYEIPFEELAKELQYNDWEYYHIKDLEEFDLDWHIYNRLHKATHKWYKDLPNEVKIQLKEDQEVVYVGETYNVHKDTQLSFYSLAGRALIKAENKPNTIVNLEDLEILE